MPGARPEDASVKIPALIHLTRLGYRFLPLAEARRDRDTNILPEDLRAAADRINNLTLSDTDFDKLLSDIRRSLALDDLGCCFFDGLKNSWHGIRVIDFAHPDNNICRVMTELPCISGRNRFRPDITLLINGLPLAFIEVKAKGSGDSMRSEYNRMMRRSGNPHLRRFINETQIMVFSDDGEYDENDLIPKRGAFYATSAYDDLVFHHFVEEEREIFHQLAPVRSEEAALILRDSRLEALADEPGFQASLSPDTPTHRLLTSLFHFRRLFFFLQYGISYLKEKEEDGSVRLSKQIMRYPQLFAVRFLEHQLQSGQPGGRWIVQESGRIPLAAIQVRYMADYYMAKHLPVRFYYLVDRPARIRGVRNAFETHGFRVQETGNESSGFQTAVLRAENWIHPPEPLITILCADSLESNPRVPVPSGSCSFRRVYFWDGAENGYQLSDPFPTRLLAMNREAVLISFSQPEEA